MSFVSRFTDKAQRLLIQELVGLLVNSSVDNIVRLSYLAEKISRNEWDRGVVRKMRRHFHERHPSAVLAKDVLENLSGNCKNKLINNLMIRQPCRDNHLTPCMLIDAPWILRDVLKKSPDVYPTCEGAEEWKGADIMTPRGEGRFALNGQASRGGKKYATAD